MIVTKSQQKSYQNKTIFIAVAIKACSSICIIQAFNHAFHFQEVFMFSRIHSIVVSLLLSVFLVACASIDQPSVVPPGAERLSVTEIRALLAQPVIFDNDISGGLSYSFSPDGKVLFSMRMLPARKAGAWRVGDEGLCVRVDSDPWECGPLYRLGNDRYYFEQPGYDNDYNTLTVRK
jgi:hypothetical protein